MLKKFFLGKILNHFCAKTAEGRTLLIEANHSSEVLFEVLFATRLPTHHICQMIDRK
jgi:hypothetical protein